MSYKKATWKVDQRVVFHSTSDPRLNGQTGSIVGLSFEDAEMSAYIVLLDNKLSYTDWKAIPITEHCLKAI